MRQAQPLPPLPIPPDAEQIEQRAVVDYVFTIASGMFTMDELKKLSALKADAYNPCLKVVMTDDKAGTETKKWQTLFENDYKTHNHRTRIEVKGVPEVQYFLPAFEKEGDTLTLLFHVARGSRTELPQIEMTGDVEYQVYVQKMYTNTGTIPNAKATELMTRSIIRNTFRKYLFHETTVSYDANTIIAECISEFSTAHTRLPTRGKRGWAAAYAVIETASTTTTSTTTGHVKKLLRQLRAREVYLKKLFFSQNK